MVREPAAGSADVVALLVLDGRVGADHRGTRQALGPRFDLREYHREALGSGYIPLWALDEKITSWIQAALPKPQSAAFNQMLESYWQELLGLNPILALSHGETQDEGLHLFSRVAMNFA